ncbi:uncharacterized protein MYCFIDRAFT_171843 [Pseudocercospora fijiensis CIRAD86]|uniref:Uncharacterized protein n=1 Tax=Pseudocercospora fijiensis (strain CIRAD86) TaxID=383855 RepID=M3A4H4_PSEFD|nr:uncharacterized protein MYCFIDRAFT_171843 [Pseudocercospora fijiensis CIRAD86]EME86019.1 hypothetical protein MYCFIDRAFT_171843 [Pseudocercospora fijiensis CIRAD86]
MRTAYSTTFTRTPRTNTPHTLIIDTTYSTNIYNLELLDIVAAGPINDTIELGVGLIRPKPDQADFTTLLVVRCLSLLALIEKSP